MDAQGHIHHLEREPDEDEGLVEVDESEMTEKQKQTRKVSKHDHRSRLGKRLGKFRNEPCFCRSGRKLKNCCGADGYMPAAAEQ